MGGTSVMRMRVEVLELHHMILISFYFMQKRSNIE